MDIKPVASDSLGVRSMATYVETDDCKVFIDPSAALAPRRYSLPPSPLEIEKLDETKKEIAGIVKKCDIIVISHYHYDHYDPDEAFYMGKKTVFTCLRCPGTCDSGDTGLYNRSET